MTTAAPLPRPRRPWYQPAVVFAVCLGVALLLTALKRGDFGPNLAYSLSIGAACWTLIHAGMVGVSGFLLRWPRTRGEAAPCDALRRGWPGWAWMTAIVLVGAPLGVAIGLTAGDWLTGHRSTSLLDLASPGTQITLAVTLLATLVSVAVISALERAALARLDAEAAQRQAAEQRLRLLEAQLEPHMLFNTLANLRVLIASDPARAQAMLDRMIAFLRATLAASRDVTHPLHAEFARLQDYLALMAMRMGPRLQVELDLPEALRDRAVPSLLLQPLVENAIKHGLEPHVSGGRVQVRAQTEGSQLRLTVRDTGAGLPDPAVPGTGFGLAQVRERLRTIYGDAASLSLHAPTDGVGGTEAVITMPLPDRDTTSPSAAFVTSATTLPTRQSLSSTPPAPPSP